MMAEPHFIITYIMEKLSQSKEEVKGQQVEVRDFQETVTRKQGEGGDGNLAEGTPRVHKGSTSEDSWADPTGSVGVSTPPVTSVREVSMGNSDEEDKITRAHKVGNRKRLLSSEDVDDNEEKSGVEFSSSRVESDSIASDTISSEPPRRKRVRERISPTSNLGTGACKWEKYENVNFEILTAAQVSARGQQLADWLEQLRFRSKNLQGKISGDFKIGISLIKQVISSLGYKAEGLGDPSSLRHKNTDLTKRLKEEKEEGRTKDIKIRELEDEIRILKSNLGWKRNTPESVVSFSKRSTEEIEVTPDIEAMLEVPMSEVSGRTEFAEEFIKHDRKTLKEIPQVLESFSEYRQKVDLVTEQIKCLSDLGRNIMNVLTILQDESSLEKPAKKEDKGKPKITKEEILGTKNKKRILIKTRENRGLIGKSATSEDHTDQEWTTVSSPRRRRRKKRRFLYLL